MMTPWDAIAPTKLAPDLFSTTNPVRDASPPSTKRFPDTEVRTESAPQRHILPRNLRHAVKQLRDGEFDELFDRGAETSRQEALDF
jgi:Flp pilus assembly secretin CpaC